MAKLPDQITVKVDNEDKDIFMSFGLLNELTKIINDPAGVSALAANHELRDEVLNSLLAVRKRSGKIQSKVDIDDVDISVEDVEMLLAWASEHVLGFFLRSLQKMVSLSQKHQTDMEGLVSFVSGSTASASETPSVGPSE